MNVYLFVIFFMHIYVCGIFYFQFKNILVLEAENKNIRYFLRLILFRASNKEYTPQYRERRGIYIFYFPFLL